MGVFIVPNIRIIPARKSMRRLHAGIYCRVSTREKLQLESLNEQISGLTRYVHNIPSWTLFDSYIDIAPGINIVNRPSFQRMLRDCDDSKLDIVLVKNISRLGRNTIELLEIYNKLITLDIRIISLQDNFDSKEDGAQLFMAIFAKIAEEENIARRQNIIMGLKMRAQSGTLRNFDRICYGYKHENRELVPSTPEAHYVKKIFDWYVYGLSILAIISKLEEEFVPSPTGKPKWSKAAIHKILINEKYTGIGTATIMGKTHIIENHHRAIVDCETFEYAQKLMLERSNIIIMPDGTKKRKKTRYSSPKNI